MNDACSKIGSIDAPGACWDVLAVPADRPDDWMPLTRAGLPERLSGLFWMNQWGFREHADTGSMECLAQSNGDFLTQKNCPAKPDLLVSFAGMPLLAQGGDQVTIVGINPNDVPTWSWFGAIGDQLSSLPSGAPTAYKFVFDADLGQAQIIATSSRHLADNLRFTMVYEGGDTWSRRTFQTPDMSDTPLLYPVHRVVDGQGNRLAKFDDYLAFATQPEVCGAHPGKIAITRKQGATDNSEVLSRLLVAPTVWGGIPT